ncbi:peptidase M50 [Haloterrigena turkmenica DSM 5511]|uniref:Peptidase M50 n=1 Tax=Haloterrigena turkmenica (strain ATCC 51198 / DSM 5511 / JCM 9101 / NCIMB 13204 / VKM B-1734 / 4k) TaxID=543526 RepID=D2RTE1_HALTV|nr:site-2 protease family protein [Haloterrigena turkmenica]ADB58984.1 peptidase M50 [Haloterrigena turkmenica DSM 5511]
MDALTTLLLLGLAAASATVLAMALEARGLLPPWVSVWGPVVTFETENGLGALDRLARPRYRRFWRRWSDVGTAISLLLLVAMTAVVLFAAYVALTREAATQVNQPRNALAIPGVNDFLPLAATPAILVGLAAAVVVHEFSHGLLARVEDVAVESAGLIFLALVPFGAFVGIDEDDEAAASTAARNRIYVAGIANNLAVALIAFLALFLLVSTSIAAVSGVAVGGVYAGTPADQAGLERGDVVTAVDGRAVEDADDLRTALDATDERVELTVAGGRDDARTVTLERSVVVTSTLEGDAASADGGERSDSGTDGGDGNATTLEPGETITAVDGTRVDTEREFRAALENRTVATLETEDSSTTIIAGAAVAAIDVDGPLATAGAPDPDGDPRTLVITRLEGERIVDSDDLLETLAEVSPGETVALEAVVDDERREYEVTLGDRNGEAVLGITTVPGTSGTTVTDLGVDPHPSAQHLGILRGQPVADGLGSSPLERGFAVFALPFAGLIAGFSTANFGGFVGSIADFYAVTGPLSVLGGSVFVAANVLFWTWWLSLLVGVFNCIPCYPLDGGKLLRTTVEAAGSRTGLERPDRSATAAMVAASAVVVVAILLVLSSPFLG